MKLLKLKKARTCRGCKALRVSQFIDTECGLGFKIRLIDHSELGCFEAVPKTRCYKPITNSEMLDAEYLMQGPVGVATRKDLEEEGAINF